MIKLGDEKFSGVVNSLKEGVVMLKPEVLEARESYMNEVASRFGLSVGSVDKIVATIGEKLDVDWWDRYKDNDETIWLNLDKKVTVGLGGDSFWPRRMLKFGGSPKQVVECLAQVVIVDKFMSEVNRPIEVKDDNMLLEFGDETKKWELKNNQAIVQFEGMVVDQVKVRGRDTCVLAVMQMLLAHSGYIGNESHVNLIQAKGELLQIAEQIGALSGDVGGTLRLHDVEYAVRPVLENTKTTLIRKGIAKNNDSLGNVGCEYFSYFEGEMDTEVYSSMMRGGGVEREASANALAIMAQQWQEGKNVIFGYTEVDQIGQFNENGHQRIINGVAMVNNEYYFHIIDPLVDVANDGWVSGNKLVKHLTGPIFWAESIEESSEPYAIKKEDVSTQNEVSINNSTGLKIEWG